MEALGQHVHQEAPDKLVRVKPDGLPAARAVGAIVLATERDAGVVGGNEAAVRDGDAMRVTGEVGVPTDLVQGLKAHGQSPATETKGGPAAGGILEPDGAANNRSAKRAGGRGRRNVGMAGRSDLAGTPDHARLLGRLDLGRTTSEIHPSRPFQRGGDIGHSRPRPGVLDGLRARLE